MLFGLFTKKNINEGVEEFKNTAGAVLLDVRTTQEYREYHIPGSINIPLQSISNIKGKVPDKRTPIFVHCLSGSRSSQAESVIKSFGYTNVKNIGGISSYQGKTV